MSETACPLCWLAPCVCSSAVHIARLESELREARAELEKHEGCMTEAAKDFDESLGQCLDRAEKAESALSAERTAREKMQAEATAAQCAANEALAEVRRSQEALKRVRESLILFDSAVYGRARDYGGQILLMRQTVDAALAAEPGEGPGGPTARVCIGSGHPCVIPFAATSTSDTYECGICGQFVRYSPDGRAVTHALPPEGHPRAAEVKNED